MLVDDWSMRDYPENTGSGSQWFFKTFGLIGPAKSYMGEMIAAVRNRAAQENLLYIETMMHVPGNSAQVQQVEANVTWNDNLSVMREELLDAGLRDICRENAEKLASLDATGYTLSNPAGKNVTVRYLYEAVRINPKKDVYTDLVQAFETANQSPLVVGINFVGEEDTYYARTDYHLHMEMIGYLHTVYPNVPIALHAGEQTDRTCPARRPPVPHRRCDCHGPRLAYRTRRRHHGGERFGEDAGYHGRRKNPHRDPAHQ